MNKNKSPQKNKPLLFLGIAILFSGIFWSQRLFSTTEIEIIGGKKSLIIHTPGQNLQWGNASFSNTSAFQIFEDSKNFSGKKHLWNTTQLTYLSRNSAIFQTKENSLLLFAPDFSEDELSQIFATKTPLSVDFWAAQSSNIPFQKLPNPKKGILFLGEKIPGKLLTQFCQEHQIPLISYAKTKGFRILKKNSWEIFTEK